MPALPAALVAYVVGVFFTCLATIYRSRRWRSAASVVLVVAWILHLVAVVRRGIETASFPLSDMAEYLLLLGLAVMSLHLLVWFRFKIDVAGLVLPPLAALAGFGALALMSRATVHALPRPRSLFLFHTTVSTLGMATLCVALAMSLIFLVQDRALKARWTLRLLERLPPLDRCDQIGFQALVIGFVLLTLGIVTGVIANAALHARPWAVGAKEAFPLLAWAVFATVLVARFKAGLRGRKSAYLTITGVTLGLLGVVGMTLGP
jgi:ABC-type uncharacterized transport system permease subunit